MLKSLIFLLAALISAPVSPAFPVQAPEFDLVITGARMIAGDGSPAILADVGLRNGRIAAIGALAVPPGARLIRARGRTLCPGFIDIHTHAETGLLRVPTADNYLLQGVTTVAGGNCGASHFPLSELFARIESSGIAVNFASFAGHNTIRAVVMGRKTASPSPRELRRMQALLEMEMRTGAVGLSTGLTYFPGRHTTLREAAALAGVIEAYDGLYATHMRSEGRDIALALEEAIRVGRRTGVRVQVSHLKLFDPSVWNQVHMISERLESAERRGVDIRADQYPYTASSAPFSTWFPRWADPVLRGRSKTTAAYTRLKAVLARYLSGILDRIYIGTYLPRPEYEGKNFRELLEDQEREVTAANAAELLIGIQRRGRAQAIVFGMREEDIESILKLDSVMVASDGEIPEFGRGKPHCRSYGTFPRVLARYVREKGIITLERAVQKMTSMPARALGLSDRGLIREGYRADLVLLDPAAVRDTATYAEPHSYPEGIDLVIVNGRIAAADGRATGVLAGRVLYGKGKAVPAD